jgi:hypothetical protein
MSLSYSAISEAPLSTTSSAAQSGEKKVPPRRQLTALSDAKSEPEAR